MVAMWSCAEKTSLFISGLTVCVSEWDRQNCSVDGVIRKGCTRKGRISTHGGHAHRDPNRSERQEPRRSVGMHTVPPSATMYTSRMGMHAEVWLFAAIVICSAGATSLSPTILRGVSPLISKIGEDDASAPFLRGRLHKQTTPFSVLEDCSTSQPSPIQSPTPIDFELQLPADRESIKQALFK